MAFSKYRENFHEISLTALAVIVIIANCGGVDCNIVYCGVDQTRDQVQLGGDGECLGFQLGLLR